MIGGGQAGMAAAYYPRRAGSDFVILDAETSPGGSWQHYWDSLHLFSPAEYSSLPGWPMPAWSPGFPPASQVVDYGTAYQSRYDLPVHRPVLVTSVNRSGGGYLVESDHGTWPARAVVNTTGTQLHTISYRSPTPFAGGKVADSVHRWQGRRHALADHARTTIPAGTTAPPATWTPRRRHRTHRARRSVRRR